ncbi:MULTISPECIES: hypothetical protein [Shewanella]|uniref:Uncharacterized protein n=1 Tax=Shewanella fidelis TaxID=173509 RepID=A0AAW8NN50_9GAMM|nr:MULTISPECIES: hypothetical protein [Shewanella]MDR8523775.1 hypothetical protein [Shewanella fidelis]MDW4810323.1 hypothetical protein [Shewanella fidelis]MDW4814468.1 hypothetical protein [Shewanella fidelis]MDW4818558.1 hypothetical protein [Shewanella fidelis]MDW4823789.1 hypothetical protein [Shewanella fidelis]
MNFKILLTLAAVLLAAWAIFHFKAQLGLLIIPLFFGLVLFVTLRLYRLMEKDEPGDNRD